MKRLAKVTPPSAIVFSLAQLPKCKIKASIVAVLP